MGAYRHKPIKGWAFRTLKKTPARDSRRAFCLWLATHPYLKPRELRVALYLALRANFKKPTELSQEEIANELGLKTTNVTPVLAELEHRRIIKRLKRTRPHKILLLGRNDAEIVDEDE